MNKKIKELLKPDSETITNNLKSLLDKEEEYAEYLYAIESSVVDIFLENKKLNDKEVISAIKNVNKNFDKDIDFFASDLEKLIYSNLVLALKEKKITGHELKLALNHILWSIDNRSWLDDKQAYVKWVTHAVDAMEPKESEAYEKKIRIFCRRKGLPEAQINALISNDFDDIDMDLYTANNKIDSEFFALDDEAKPDFVVQHFTQAPFLLDLLFTEFIEAKDHDSAETLCKRILENMPDFPPVELLLGVVYKEKGNKMLAKHHFENTLRILESIPEEAMPIETTNEMIKDVKKLLKDVSK